MMFGSVQLELLNASTVELDGQAHYQVFVACLPSLTLLNALATIRPHSTANSLQRSFCNESYPRTRLVCSPRSCHRRNRSSSTVRASGSNQSQSRCVELS